MGLYSYTEAINHMLLVSGEHLVSDLSTEAGVDISVAEFILKKTIKTYQLRGLANNRYVVTIAPDVNGKINLPSTACYAQVVEPLFDPTTGEVIQTTIKSNPTRLFNITKQTDVFDKSLQVEVIITLGNEASKYGWDDIDSPMQKAIMDSAAREYQMVTQGDVNVDKILATSELFHRARGRASDVFKKIDLFS
jgi:hypothetical protein